MSSSTLIRWGGLVSIVSGAGLAVGFVLTSVMGGYAPIGVWALFIGVTALFFAVMAIYAVQSKESGLLGLLGFALTVIGSVFVVADGGNSLAVVSGIQNQGTAQRISAFLTPFELLALFGFILLGIATARAGVLPRWGGWLLVIGTIVSFGTLLQIAILPAVGGALLGAAFAWLGWTLWSEERMVTRQPKKTM